MDEDKIDHNPVNSFRWKVLLFVYENIYPGVAEPIVTNGNIDKHLSFFVNKQDKQHRDPVFEYGVLLKNYDYETNAEKLEEIAKNLVEESASWLLKLKNCQILNNKFYLQLDRKECFRTFVADVCRQLENYGSGDRRDKTVNIIVADFMYDDKLSKNSLRAILLAEHVYSLLSSDGHECHIHYPGITETTRLHLRNLGFTTLHEHVKSSVDDVKKKIKSQFLRESSERTYKLNAREYIEREKLPRGKDGYSSNLETIEVSIDEDRIFTFIADLNSVCEQQGTVIHIVGADRDFRQQKFDILWRVFGGPQDQRHLCVGSVTKRKINDRELSLDDLIRLRKKENREACEHKHGELPDEDWQRKIDALTLTGIKFELLSSNARGEVKLEICDDTGTGTGTGTGSGSTHRAGTFVLYNYARLSNLLRKFVTDVKRGIYPPLPALEDVDFSLLREQEEWDLMLHYVLPYRGLVTSVLAESGQVKCKLDTHKICQFLIKFSRKFSSYYNRCHILGESRPHLYPMMYARLYLLKAVQQVLKNALSLLNIQPPQQM